MTQSKCMCRVYYQLSDAATEFMRFSCDGVFELERHECDAFWSIDFFLKMSGKDVLVENKLFSTLETTVGRMEASPRILLADTIGFIDNLPMTMTTN